MLVYLICCGDWEACNSSIEFMVKYVAILPPFSTGHIVLYADPNGDYSCISSSKHNIYTFSSLKPCFQMIKYGVTPSSR